MFLEQTPADDTPTLTLRDDDSGKEYTTTDYTIRVVGRRIESSHIEIDVDGGEDLARIAFAEDLVAVIGDAPPIPMIVPDVNIEGGTKIPVRSSLTLLSATLGDHSDVADTIDQLRTPEE